MANLLSWLGNGVKRLENTVNNDVIKPIQRDVIRPVQGAVAQVNPLDNNRTYNTVAQHGASYAPAPPRSVASQIYHSAPANIASSIIKPFAATGAGVSNTIGNAEVNIAHGLHLAKNIHPLTNKQQFGNRFGGYVGENTPKNFGKNVAQVALNVAAPGASKVASKAFESVLPKVVPKLVSHTIANAGVGAPIGGAFNTLNGGSFKQGAQAGALLGAGGTVAPELARGAVKVVKPAAKTVATTTQKTVNPQAFALNQSYKQFQRSYDTAKSPAEKQALNNQMAQNRVQYRDATQSGFAKVPGNKPNVPEVPKVSDNSNVLYHGSTGKPLVGNTPLEHMYLSKDKSTAQMYGSVTPYDASRLKIATEQDLIREGVPRYIPDKKGIGQTNPNLIKDLKARGYDGIDNSEHNQRIASDEPSEVQVWNKNKLKPVTQPTQGASPNVAGVQKEVARLRQEAQMHRGYDNKTTADGLDAEANKLEASIITQGAKSRLETATPKINALAPPKAVVQQPPVPIQNEGALNVSRTSQIPTPRNSQPARLPAVAERTSANKFQEPATSPNNTPLTPGTQERGFTQSVKQSANFTPELKKAVDSTYNPNTDKQTISNTQTFMKQGIESAHNDVLHRIQSNARPDKQLVNDAGTVMQTLDAQGETAKAQHIHDLLSEHLTNSGQVSQAAGLLLRRSPDGIYHKAVSDLKKAGIDVTPTIDDQLKAHREAIRATAPDSLERNVAIQHLKQFVTKNIPTSKLNNFFAFWRAGLLTGPRTVGKILTSHGVHAPFEKLKDVPASMIDRTIGLLRKDNRRSLVFTTQGKAGFAQGAKAGFGKQGYLRTGIDIQPGNNSIEFHNNANYGSSVPGKIAQAYVDGIGRLHGSLYKPFFGYGHLNSLYSLAKAESKNAGLKGSAADAFQQDFVRTPPNWAQDIAKSDAENLTFQQETQLGKFASAIQTHGGIVGKVIAPFTRIPSAIATDLFNYSPVGGMKTILDGIKAARTDEGWSIADQRKFSQGLGRSIVGTAAVVPGYLLYQKGMMNLAYPTDPKEQKLWALQGRTADSVLIGGKWRALGSLGPLGAVLSIGGYLGESQKKGESASQSALNALAGGLKTIESQPYVSGISGATNAIQDPGRYLTSLEKQYAGSIIPTGLAQTASSFDNQQRQINGAKDAIKSKIPGMRQSLAPKTDAFGQTIPAGETGPGALVDPFYSSNQRPTSPVTNEIQRLQNVGQGVLPSSQPVKNTFDGVKTTLTKPQAQQLGAKVGQTTQTLWNQTISAPIYKSLPDDQKHQMLANILSDTTSATKAQYAADNNLGQYAPGFSGKAKPLSAKQQAIVDGKFDPNAYAPKQATATKIKSTKAKSTKLKSAKTARAKSTKVRSVSLASYIKTAKSTKIKPIKTSKAPTFKAGSAKFKTVSLHQYRVNKQGLARISHKGKAVNTA